METTYGEGISTKAIKVSNLITDAMSPYNIILGFPTTNALGAFISTWYLVLKYLLHGGWDETIWGDHQSVEELGYAPNQLLT